MRLEPHEFKQCLVSLGYNLKEGEKVSQFVLFAKNTGNYHNYSVNSSNGAVSFFTSPVILIPREMKNLHGL